jgi:hypothetical protein
MRSALPPNEAEKLGFLAANGRQAFIHDGRRLQTVALKAIEHRVVKHVELPIPTAQIAASIERFLTNPPLDLTRFSAGLSALIRRDWSYFGTRLDWFSPHASKATESNEWADFWSTALPGDLVQTFDSASVVSRLISKVTHGPWSHSAMYIGNGMLREMRAGAGLVYTPVSAYCRPTVHLALYRAPGIEFDLGKLAAQGWVPYSYFKAFLVGLQAWRGQLRSIPTPNDLLLMPGLELIRRR